MGEAELNELVLGQRIENEKRKAEFPTSWSRIKGTCIRAMHIK